MENAKINCPEPEPNTFKAAREQHTPKYISGKRLAVDSLTLQSHQQQAKNALYYTQIRFSYKHSTQPGTGKHGSETLVFYSLRL